jgi:hypothetical protein
LPAFACRFADFFARVFRFSLMPWRLSPLFSFFDLMAYAAADTLHAAADAIFAASIFRRYYAADYFYFLIFSILRRHYFSFHY